MEPKKELAVLQTGTVRELVDKVNNINAVDAIITKDTIVDIFRIQESIFLLYFK